MGSQRDGHDRVTFTFTFSRKRHTVLTVAVPVYIPSNSVLCNLASIYLLPFDDSRSNRCEMILHCDFDLYFPDD